MRKKTDAKVTALDHKPSLTERWAELRESARNHPKVLSALGIIGALLLCGGIAWGVQTFRSHQMTDVAPKRVWQDKTGQTLIPEPKLMEGVGKGRLATVDNGQKGKKIDVPVISIDAIGGKDGAELAPPKDVGEVGYYVRSAPYGSPNKGTSVMTAHIDYNGVVGVGSVFTSLRKGDPVTVTDSQGNQYHYQVDKSPQKLTKQDPSYVKKTMGTINRMKGKNSLVLITCGGRYTGGPLGYEDNIIVTAKYITQTPAKNVKK